MLHYELPKLKVRDSPIGQEDSSGTAQGASVLVEVKHNFETLTEDKKARTFHNTI